MFKKILVLFLVSILTACGGISSDSAPNATFTVKVNYKDVFERAKAQAEYCWRSETNYPVVADLNVAQRSALVYVTGLLGSTRMAQLVARAIDDNTTEVKVTVNGISIWNKTAVLAMKEVVEFGVPTCTSYMPSKD
jgi:hypothetical protein